MAKVKFKAKKGQVDYTNIRYCPVVNCAVIFKDKILVVQRSQELYLYPGYWNGISGFLDDHKNVEEKVREELSEETGIQPNEIIFIRRGDVLVQESEEYKKTWIVFPVHVEINTNKIGLNWEASSYKWLTLKEVREFDIVPGFKAVLDKLF